MGHLRQLCFRSEGGLDDVICRWPGWWREAMVPPLGCQGDVWADVCPGNAPRSGEAVGSLRCCHVRWDGRGLCPVAVPSLRTGRLSYVVKQWANWSREKHELFSVKFSFQVSLRSLAESNLNTSLLTHNLLFCQVCPFPFVQIYFFCHFSLARIHSLGLLVQLM